MDMRKLNRRTFLGSAMATAISWRAMAQARKPRVGCQANAFVVRNGSFEALLPVLQTIRSLGYAGFECNNHLVQSEFADPTAARRKVQDAGLEFIGMHTSMRMRATSFLSSTSNACRADDALMRFSPTSARMAS